MPSSRKKQYPYYEGATQEPGLNCFNLVILDQENGSGSGALCRSRIGCESRFLHGFVCSWRSLFSGSWLAFVLGHTVDRKAFPRSVNIPLSQGCNLPKALYTFPKSETPI